VPDTFKYHRKNVDVMAKTEVPLALRCHFVLVEKYIEYILV
jgi:hypothetical protein